MRFSGKIIGAICGFLIGGGNIITAAIGFIIGHIFDVGVRQSGSHFQFGNVNKTRQSFFDTTFAVMGFVAKSDGRVTEQDIQMARVVMSRMRLDEAGKRRAVEQFNRGKQADFDWHDCLAELQHYCRSSYLLRMFLDMQVQAAFANGSASQTKRELLQAIAQQLGFPPIDFSHIESMLYGQYRQQYQHQRSYSPPPQQSMPLDEAYEVLGLQKGASQAEVKRAYRRLMSKNHPDKLVAKGLPESMIKVATEKTQQIQKAYDLIKNQTS